MRTILLLPLLALPLRAFELSGETRAHDPSSVVRDGDVYRVFHTGPGGRTMWSKDLKTWHQGPPVLKEPLPWWDRFAPGTNHDIWAPDAIRVGDRWLYYYSVSVFGKSTSAIGLLSNETLDPDNPRYRWQDEGAIVTTTRGSNFNAIDPSLFRDRDGRLWMAFGSYWSGIKLIELDPKTGKRFAGDTNLIALAKAPPPSTAVEAACLTRLGDSYFLFLNWGQCCQGVRSTYEIRVGRSDRVTGPFVDREGRSLADGGGSPFLASEGRRIGPGHVGIFEDRGVSWCSTHFYDAADSGKPRLRIARLLLDAEGWPRLDDATTP